MSTALMLSRALDAYHAQKQRNDEITNEIQNLMKEKADLKSSYKNGTVTLVGELINELEGISFPDIILSHISMLPVLSYLFNDHHELRVFLQSKLRQEFSVSKDIPTLDTFNTTHIDLNDKDAYFFIQMNLQSILNLSSNESTIFMSELEELMETLDGLVDFEFSAQNETSSGDWEGSVELSVKKENDNWIVSVVDEPKYPQVENSNLLNGLTVMNETLWFKMDNYHLWEFVKDKSGLSMPKSPLGIGEKTEIQLNGSCMGYFATDEETGRMNLYLNFEEIESLSEYALKEFLREFENVKISHQDLGLYVVFYHDDSGENFTAELKFENGEWVGQFHEFCEKPNTKQSNLVKACSEMNSILNNNPFLVSR